MSSAIPTTLHPAEYTLRLSTGEAVEVSQFDSVSHPQLASPAVRAACASVLDRVPTVTREVMEAAKVGDDRALRSALKAQPSGALVMVRNHRCAQWGDCVMHGKACTTTNVRKRVGQFPECWEYEPEAKAGDEEGDARGVGTAVVHAWRGGRHALFVVG